MKLLYGRDAGRWEGDVRNKGGSIRERGLFITVIKHKKRRALSSQTNAAVVGWWILE